MLRFWLIVAGLSVVACKPEPAPAEGKPTVDAEAAPAGDADAAGLPKQDLRADQTVIKFAVYGMPGGDGTVLAAAKAIHAEKFSEFNLATSDVVNKTPSVLLVAPPMTEFAPPSVDRLRVFGRGLPEAQAHAVQESREAVVMAFAGSKEQSAAVHRAALQMAADVAAKAGGLIWDEDTGQLFSVDAWAERMAKDIAEPASLGQHFAVRSYREGAMVRLVTFGLSKFGLPDLVVDNVPVASASPMGNLVNLAAAALVASPTLDRPGTLVIDLEALGIERPKGAASRIEVNLAKAEPKKGGPDNRTMAIVFPGPAESLHERQAKLLAKVTGAKDEVTRSPMDSEIVDASRQAQRELAALRPAFDAGLAKHETLLVKAPFPARTGGQEWMWVEVQGWNGKKLSGILQNEPKLTDKVEAGSNVEVNQALVLDYIHKKPDGTVVGNATAKILERKRSEAMHGWDAGDPKTRPRLGEAVAEEPPAEP